MRVRRSSLYVAVFVFAASNLPAESFVYVPPACAERERSSPTDAGLLACFAPVFVVADGERAYNRIGTPEIRLEKEGERVRVNPDLPAVFVGTRSDRIGRIEVRHLLYRIHFEKLAFKPSVFYEMHRNVGLLAIVTLAEPDLRPILFTTVYTCGCYRALLPTDLFPAEALPPSWPAERKRVLGKSLPAVVRHPEPGRSRLIVRMASKTHRVEDILTLPDLPSGNAVSLPLRSIEDLHQLPVLGSEGRVGSFFYTKGALKGHVRGAWSPIEGLTAGVLLLDLTLGMDKDLGDPAVTGTPFYTSLLPWRREVSRLDRFDPLMRYLKFRLERLP